MIPQAQKIERDFKQLPPAEKAELFDRLESLVNEDADHVSLQRHHELASGSISPLTEEDVHRRLKPRRR